MLEYALLENVANVLVKHELKKPEIAIKSALWFIEMKVFKAQAEET